MWLSGRCTITYVAASAMMLMSDLTGADARMGQLLQLVHSMAVQQVRTGERLRTVVGAQLPASLPRQKPSALTP